MSKQLTTDEQILALVASGKFTLPNGLTLQTVDGRPHRWWEGELTVVPQKAHDLCAVHFLRGRWVASRWVNPNGAIGAALCRGDSAGAIDALYRAVAR